MGQGEGRPVSPNDVQWWSLIVGLGVFVGLVMVIFTLRRVRERRHGPTSPAGEFVADRSPSTQSAYPEEPERSARRRPVTPPPSGEPGELASAIRSAILRTIAERAPAGWTALILSPPPHRERMTWHLHLAPDVALVLRDGRTITASPPAATHEWQIARDRVVGVGEGDPEPGPSGELSTIRVTGPYLTVVVQMTEDQAPTLVAQVVVSDGDTPPQPRATATDPRAITGALREAVELAVGSRLAGATPAVGYALASWSAHERTWLTIGR
jgi:hypothetical protein